MGESGLAFESPSSTRVMLFTAAMAALAFVLGAVAIPVYPNVHFQFSMIATFIVAATNGPILGFIVGFIGILYPGLILWGEVLVPVGYGLKGLLAALLNKKLPFPIACFIAVLIVIPYWIITELYVSGYPWELIWAIQIKVFFNDGIVSPLIAWGLLKIKGIGRYIPVSWDSLTGRALLEKGNL